jgi:hypothetical protein
MVGRDRISGEARGILSFCDARSASSLSMMLERDSVRRISCMDHDDRVTEAAMVVQMTLPGTVRADGSLELDDRLAMPEGRVLVTVRPVGDLTRTDPRR